MRPGLGIVAAVAAVVKDQHLILGALSEEGGELLGDLRLRGFCVFEIQDLLLRHAAFDEKIHQRIIETVRDREGCGTVFFTRKSSKADHHKACVLWRPLGRAPGFVCRKAHTATKAEEEKNEQLH
jgi:hypothetical protein